MVWVYFSLPTSGWIILVTELLSKPQYVSRSLPSSTELSKHLIKLAASDWFLGWAFILNGPFTSWLTVRDWRKNLRLFIWFDLRQTRFVKNQDWQLDHQSQIVSNFNISHQPLLSFLSCLLYNKTQSKTSEIFPRLSKFSNRRTSPYFLQYPDLEEI